MVLPLIYQQTGNDPAPITPQAQPPASSWVSVPSRQTALDKQSMLGRGASAVLSGLGSAFGPAGSALGNFAGQKIGGKSTKSSLLGALGGLVGTVLTGGNPLGGLAGSWAANQFFGDSGPDPSGPNSAAGLGTPTNDPMGGFGDYSGLEGIGGEPATAANDFGAVGGLGGDPSTYRKGGYVPNTGSPKVEPKKKIVHETEFILRPEAVKAIGIPTLQILNGLR